MHYHQWAFIREVELPIWQRYLHDATAYGNAHGVTDLRNFSAALATLSCDQPVRNLTSLEDSPFVNITAS